MPDRITIRDAKPADLDAVTALDQTGRKEDKPAYWRGIFEYYVLAGRQDRICLVAEKNDTVTGLIVGEVRAWEFGSAPCGWVFTLFVCPAAREHGIGKLMFDEICQRMRAAGVSTVRTMVNLDNRLTLSFFRSMGLRTGRYVELEKTLD